MLMTLLKLLGAAASLIFVVFFVFGTILVIIDIIRAPNVKDEYEKFYSKYEGAKKDE